MAGEGRCLLVELSGEPVAELTVGRRGRLRCRYLASAFDRFPPGTPLLSCSLRLHPGHVDAAAFFDGVLPEGPHRAQLAAAASVAANDTFGLLARYGRDVAGAMVVYDAEATLDPRTPAVEILDDDGLEREVAELPERPLGIHDDSELSLAGLQDKMLLVSMGGGRWARPLHGTPSTHILKVDHRIHRGVVAAEAEALSLAAAVGLTTVTAEVVNLAGLDCLIVSRFDRLTDATGRTTRIHQEDICQALGRVPTQKYEIRRGGGGPEFADVARLLDIHGEDGAAQLDRLVAVVTFTALIGNADAHGKNLALLHTTPGRVELAPLYDQVPTTLWPGLATDAAMTIGGRLNLATIGPDDVAREARSWHHDPGRAADIAVATARALGEAIALGRIDGAGRLAGLVGERAARFLR